MTFFDYMGLMSMKKRYLMGVNQPGGVESTRDYVMMMENISELLINQLLN